jgi:hypothetical protein
MGQLESNLVGMFIAKFIGVFFVEQNYTKETRGSNFAYLKGTCILNLNFSSNFDVFFVVVEWIESFQ